ncbi:MAG: T9SS type A sorting domain-containing protein, partial [Ferruginibacter sp.]|nr:T9SS type A sorting domain-containing protein [Ferruginibacter sp.]
FTAYSAVEAQDISASYYTFAWAASGGLPNYASTYAFTAGAEVILGTVTFSTAANANTVVVNAVDYQSASTYGGNTTAAIWTMQQDAANTDVTTYGSLFYQSLASGSTPGSDAPLSVGSNPDQKLFLTSTPLPVTLVSFKGSIANCTSVLKWKTSAEYNSNYFGIERSIDGISYSEIARVDSKNSGGGAAYTYTDKSLNAGINYYRLKATDFDGIHKYSEILTLNSDCNYTPIAVWPNPAIDNVTVTGLQGRTKLTLIDAGGKQVATFTTTAINQKINMGRFSRGNYTIAVTAADGTVTTLKLIKI